ncbi:MAG: D-glycero-beta-D-manno-heptose 1-phosphate adenylyltransferase [Desulfobulbaceae bacterium]|nr:D-glycero-beta-D-manno-heptose 1-phosphate adenylyltransferase [Desulfobulbaceae bacterium]
MIVGPDGRVLSIAAGKEEAGGLRIDPGLVSEIRARFNTAVPSPRRFFDRDKILKLPELAELVQQYKEGGCRVVFTNGCFDLLHEGHVTYLEKARQQGDCLVVGLNTDASIRSIKGPDRPVNEEMSRARVLAALGCVDHVVLFGEETPLNLITTLMPDVLVKGADWSVETIVGAREVIEGGGRVATIDLVDDVSTTGLIGKIRSDRSP